MTPLRWTADRPHTLVVACSDGRLQEQTDECLHTQLGLAGFDRFYVPGGGRALASSGRDFIRAQQLRRECGYLIGLHEVERVIYLTAPAKGGRVPSIAGRFTSRKTDTTSRTDELLWRNPHE